MSTVNIYKILTPKFFTLKAPLSVSVHLYLFSINGLVMHSSSSLIESSYVSQLSAIDFLKPE